MSQTKPKQRRYWTSNETLASAVSETSLGCVLVTTSECGLCSVALGSDAAQLQNHLRHRFPHSNLAAADINRDPRAWSYAAQIAQEIETPTGNLDLPLDIRGTEFQRKVWNALREIPLGQTVTYTDIARCIGTPSAVRAVGTACGANRLAILVPCHRVISTSGGLSGYRWGLEWKRALLEREAAQPG